MSNIRMLLRIAGRRLEIIAFAHRLHLVALILAILALAMALADRAPGEPFVAWRWVAPALAVGAIALAMLLWARRRLTELQVALEVDERLDLRERLSTALHCHGRDDAFAQAAVEDAVKTAADPRAREMVRRKFAFVAPMRWWSTPLIVVLAVTVLQLPQADLFAADAGAEREALVAARQNAQASLEVLVKAVEDKPALSAELGDLANELAAPAPDPESLEKPEEVKREALKKVTELNRRLDEILNGEKGKSVKALKDMLAKLDTPEEGSARELAGALAKGDFVAAKKALEEMLEQAEKGELTEEQKEKLAEALKNLAEQLDRLAQQKKDLEMALEQAGLNPQLANNPQALQQALEQAQNLNEQQKQQLQQMVQAQQQAQKMCEGLGGACMKMGQAMQGGELGPGGEAMQGQLGQLEQLEMLLQEAQAAAAQCQGQGMGLGQGMNLDQAMQQWMQGGGMGDWGQGSGGRGPKSKTPTGKQMTRAQVPTVEGEVIASMLIDGTPVTGESRAKLRKVVAAAAAGYDEAVTEDSLPRQYHEPMKHYFGELERQVEAVETPNGDEEEQEKDEQDEGSSDPPASDE